MEARHQPGEIIAQQYRIISCLGEGGIGITYQAADLADGGKPVALKALSLRRMQDWKVLDLFERETRVLSQLDHPAIPRYLNYFQTDTPQDRCFYLVQDLAPGRSLAALVAEGWRADESEVRRLATQVLEVLIYLHSRLPAVIHRDIKPDNIIRRQDGQIYLVDFGSVKDTYRDTLLHGGTVVGTYGYMAPEQFRGQAVPATDLYGLGTTLLFLLSGQSPAELPQQRMKLDFRGQIQVSAALADWLETMVEPALEDRFASAEEALRALRGEYRSSPGITKLRQPAGSRIYLKRTPSKLIVDIPPAGLQSQTLPLLGFALFWNGFIAYWTVGAISMGAPLLFVLFSLPFWVIGFKILSSALFGLLGHTHLEVDRQTFCIQRRLLGLSRQLQGKTADIDQVELQTQSQQNQQQAMALAIAEGVRTHRFGSNMTRVEQKWLVQELSDFLK